MRPSHRQPDELRPVTLDRGVVKYAEGSCFVKFGDTHVLVTATLEERLPPWLKGQARGWVTGRGWGTALVMRRASCGEGGSRDDPTRKSLRLLPSGSDRVGDDSAHPTPAAHMAGAR